jgi:hypothetical protein
MRSVRDVRKIQIIPWLNILKTHLNIKRFNAGRGDLDGEAQVLDEDHLLIVLAGAALITLTARSLLTLLLLLG